MKPSHLLAAAFALSLATPVFAAGGDVTAVVVGGTLTITGDTGDNEIAVTPGGAGEFTVTGLNGTTVNLTTDSTLSGVRTIQADMGAGALFYDVRVRVTRLGEAAGIAAASVAVQTGD